MIEDYDIYLMNRKEKLIVFMMAAVVVFMVIAPDFTSQSVQECVDFALNNDAQMLLITANELKNVAEMWAKKHPGEIFNLGYFKQNGRFDISLLNL